MKTVSDKYANSSKYYMDDTDFFSTEAITVPIGFRLFTIAQLSPSKTIGKYLAKWDRVFIYLCYKVSALILTLALLGAAVGLYGPLFAFGA